MGDDPEMAKPKKPKKSGGSRFDWHPKTYADAKHYVDMARNGTGLIGQELAKVMPQAIRTLGGITGLGGLTCPTPDDDPNGTYRIGLDAEGRPQIQRQNDQGGWDAVD